MHARSSQQQRLKLVIVPLPGARLAPVLVAVLPAQLMLPQPVPLAPQALVSPALWAAPGAPPPSVGQHPQRPLLEYHHGCRTRSRH